MNNQRKWLAAMGCMAIGAGTVPMAVAQQDGSDAIGLEEVVVTARKRTEALIEVPVAVSVLTSEDIQQRGIQNLQDVALFTPGLSYFDAIQNQLGTPVIRGLSQTNLNSPDRNVAVFYGGVYLSNLNATNLEILDVERIEVVKGPQSALYGRNAFNGCLLYTSWPYQSVSPASSMSMTLRCTAGRFVQPGVTRTRRSHIFCRCEPSDLSCQARCFATSVSIHSRRCSALNGVGLFRISRRKRAG